MFPICCFTVHNMKMTLELLTMAWCTQECVYLLGKCVQIIWDSVLSWCLFSIQKFKPFQGFNKDIINSFWFNPADESSKIFTYCIRLEMIEIYSLFKERTRGRERESPPPIFACFFLSQIPTISAYVSKNHPSHLSLIVNSKLS